MVGGGLAAGGVELKDERLRLGKKIRQRGKI
jgi:hypothetical protein